MYAIPRHASQLVSEWAEELGARYGCSAQEILERPVKLLSFPNERIRIELMDGSSVDFKYAFHIVSEAKRAIAVFTEHCGHHVFPYHEAKVFRDGVLAYEQQGA